jgi:DNA-binding protein H-NS
MGEADSKHHYLSSTQTSNAETLDLASMSVDELWKLHEATAAILAEKIAAEITVLQRHLDRLSQRAPGGRRRSRKSPEPTGPSALPKYRNPENPSETWNGRGRRPKWINAQLSSGVELESLSIR